MFLQDAIGALELSSCNLATVRRVVSARFRELRCSAKVQCFFLILHWKELTRETTLVCDCGLEPDIRKRIAEGHLSANASWAELLELEAPVSRFTVSRSDKPPRAIMGQLDVVFSRHPASIFNAAVVRCDTTDRLIFLEAHEPLDCSEVSIRNASDAELLAVSERIYLAILRDIKRQVVSDWEKAVHELASPLDFIYSNSDFLLRYFSSPEVTDEMKTTKLQDFKLMATLLINRLHQFRFAFAGVPNQMKPDWFDLYRTCMPITHMWHHEALRKNLRFKYEELRGLPMLNTDPEIVQFVLFNLLSNAIKYSYDGTEIQLYGKVRSDGRLSIGVRNQGIGVPEEDWESVFNYGFRAEAAREFDSRGMGIGLPVCRQLCRVLGGSIYMLAGTQPWTVFEFTIPVH